MTTTTVNFRGQPFTLRYDGLVTPTLNRRVTDSEYQTACLLADRIAALAAAAPDVGRKPNVAADVSSAANAWAGLGEAWHPLFSKVRNDVEHLRLFCQPFTGFDPITEELNGASPKTLPADLEAQLAGRYQKFRVHCIELIDDQRRLPAQARVQLPLVFGEVGQMIDGVLASYDAWSLQMQINGLHGTGIIRRLSEQAAARGRATVVDIGSGFGGIGYQLGRAMAGQRLRFVAVDLPASLIFAAIYLSALWDDQTIFLALSEGYLSLRTGETVPRLPDDFAALFVVNYLAERVLSELKPIDLIVNFRSMQEMSDTQVAHYGQLARDVLGMDGLLYEQNGTSRSFDRDVKAILGGIFAHGGLVDETDPPHRGMASASVWSNQPIKLGAKQY